MTRNAAYNKLRIIPMIVLTLLYQHIEKYTKLKKIETKTHTIIKGALARGDSEGHTNNHSYKWK